MCPKFPLELRDVAAHEDWSLALSANLKGSEGRDAAEPAGHNVCGQTADPIPGWLREQHTSQKLAAIQYVGWNALGAYGNVFECQGPRVTSRGSFCSVEL